MQVSNPGYVVYTIYGYISSPVCQPCLQPLLASPIAELASNQNATHELTVGGNFTLSVKVTSFNIPLIAISWAHEGNTLTGDEDRVNIQTSAVLPVSSGSVTSTLQIREAVLTDAGYYNAIVESSTESSTVQFEVSIILLPGMVQFKIRNFPRGGGGGGKNPQLWKAQVKLCISYTLKARCVTYLYYDPNLNCCYEKMQVNK